MHGDRSYRLWRLFKTSLAASNPSTEPADELTWEKHPTELVVAAQLLELIERESARRFVIHCGNKDGLLVSRESFQFTQSC